VVSTTKKSPCRVGRTEPSTGDDRHATAGSRDRVVLAGDEVDRLG
jgi:hypothetical protein